MEQSQNNIPNTIKDKFRIEVLTSKLNELFKNIKPKFINIDNKFATFMPNSKLRKVVYIAVSSLFSLMFLIIILGLLLSPLRKSGSQTQNLFGKKPAILQESSKPTITLNENQKQINDIKIEIDNLTFPDKRINIPLIESDLKIDQSR